MRNLLPTFGPRCGPHCDHGPADPIIDTSGRALSDGRDFPPMRIEENGWRSVTNLPPSKPSIKAYSAPAALPLEPDPFDTFDRLA